MATQRSLLAQNLIKTTICSNPRRTNIMGTHYWTSACTPYYETEVATKGHAFWRQGLCKACVNTAAKHACVGGPVIPCPGSLPAPAPPPPAAPPARHPLTFGDYTITLVGRSKCGSNQGFMSSKACKIKNNVVDLWSKQDTSRRQVFLVDPVHPTSSTTIIGVPLKIRSKGRESAVCASYLAPSAASTCANAGATFANSPAQWVLEAVPGQLNTVYIISKVCWGCVRACLAEAVGFCCSIKSLDCRTY